ncbi:uncharacterized protein LOC106637719 [Copidosoma floridanum]|uniref:uncharacterized protein LOC106637719 n=1 Tax=Copidosoma floridanum TaxID=29053 RepID=UPI0006C96114|nr:uncharacterized protein LOC106637719 [Copidosoma floridanum]
MEIWDSAYYVHSRICLRMFGLWPLQGARNKVIFRVATVLAVSTILIPHILKTYEVRHQLHYFLVCMPSLLYYSQFLTKFVHIAVKANKARKILETINRDFSCFKNKSLRVLHDYSDTGRKFNTLYFVYMCFSVCFYNSMAFIPHALDALMPLNESRPRHPIRYVKYNIPRIEDHFNFILVHGFVLDLVSMLIIIGFDTLLFNFAQHACALFKIVVVELHNSIEESGHAGAAAEESLGHRQSLVYRRIANSIVVHKRALELNELDSLCTIVNLLVVSITLANATFTELETVVNKHKGDYDVALRFAFFTIGQFLVILYCNYPGQLVKDHSSLIYDSCCEFDWYRQDIPMKAKKLLVLIMMKSQTPSCLTCGKLFVLDLQNFISILKASISYFAVLMSIQK